MRELIQFLIALLVHECGHILAALVLAVPVVSFNVRSFGGIFIFDFSHIGYLTEGIVHFSGPLFGIIASCFAHLTLGQSANYFVGVSIALSAVNLLPIEGFDGGGVARCILSQFFLPDTVWRVCRVLSFVGVTILWMGVIWAELRAGGNLGLLIFIIGIMLGQMK